MNQPWAERYRPKHLNECILPEKTKSYLNGFVSKGELPNLLLSGSPGTGKTTVARALARELEYDFMIINASDEGRLIDTLRTKIRDYASSVSFTGGRKMILLDEADNLPKDTVQPALRAFMEEFSDNCTFVLTCNRPAGIIDALHSRMSRINFEIPNEDRKRMMVEMSKRIFMILDDNEIDYDKKVIGALVKDQFPNFRKMINEIQMYASSGKIDSGILTSITATTFDDLVDALRNRRFNKMREWVAVNPSVELYTINRYLWENSKELVVSETIPELVLTLARYQSYDATVEDKEINKVAMLTEVMSDVTFKEG